MNHHLRPGRFIRPGLLLILSWISSTQVRAAAWQEDFAQDPAGRGWIYFGDSTLFRWDGVHQALNVTWDSARSNSFIARPLGTVLALADDFSFSFDLVLHDIAVGTTPGKSNEFEIAVGLINLSSATNANSYRGAGQDAIHGVHNLVEFDYFPDAGFGDTFATTVVATNNRIFPAHTFPLELTTEDVFHLTFTYSSSNQTLRTQATRNSLPYGLPPDNSLADLVLTGRPDFRVDAFAVTSYSDAVQIGPPTFQGSVLAHGVLDNVSVQVPDPPVTQLALHRLAGNWVAQFRARGGWNYGLERSLQLPPRWTSATAVIPGSDTVLQLTDTNAPASAAWYRVRAERP